MPTYTDAEAKAILVALQPEMETGLCVWSEDDQQYKITAPTDQHAGFLSDEAMQSLDEMPTPLPCVNDPLDTNCGWS